MKLGAKELREVPEKDLSNKLKHIKRRPMYFILENIYDTYNVGGLFRLSDALAAKGIYLVGETETPPNTRIKKASIGTYKVVPWKYKKTTKEAIRELKKLEKNIKFFAIEQHKSAKKYTYEVYGFPLALIVGNETTGILPETLKLCDKIVEIPMFGVNKSLNVIVSAAIVAYWIVNEIG